MTALAADGVNALAAALAPVTLFESANGQAPAANLALPAGRSFDNHTWLLFLAESDLAGDNIAGSALVPRAKRFSATGDGVRIDDRSDAVVIKRVNATSFAVTRVGGGAAGDNLLAIYGIL